NIQTFAVCKLIADEIKHTLINLIKQGETITEVTGYRVGMTRGKTDKYHNRTQFSNHSFGIALDINAQQNGLYDQCMHFSNNCRLIRGGPWKPGYKGSMTREGSIVRQMEQLGLRWGGLIAGKQKDFMHFSPSGY
ncbi:MAG: M15 family metallopeptidase, partial [Gammaproteobacteria bacterium]|nr:M15 family metallopeptidase [Gammaproteobacteria bacterium]